MKNVFGNHAVKRSLKILVVEDDEALTEILLELFAIEGHAVRNFYNTTDIIPLVNEFRPDLVLLDYMLPNVNGGELCSQIKRDEQLFNIPVIIYSAFSKVLLSLGDYGCDAFIAKPFDLDHLLRQIEKLVARYQRAA